MILYNSFFSLPFHSMLLEVYLECGFLLKEVSGGVTYKKVNNRPISGPVIQLILHRKLEQI